MPYCLLLFGLGNMVETVIEVDSLVKQYEKLRAVDGISFKVYEGEV
jgi:ABC-type multidrug transport system ATPase subunit